MAAIFSSWELVVNVNGNYTSEVCDETTMQENFRVFPKNTPDFKHNRKILVPPKYLHTEINSDFRTFGLTRQNIGLAADHTTKQALHLFSYVLRDICVIRQI